MKRTLAFTVTTALAGLLAFSVGALAAKPLDAVPEFASELTGTNIGGFSQAADDTRAVIHFMHTWPVPGEDGTRSPCRDTGEATPMNNLSYPVIWSDGVSVLAPLSPTEWTFAPIADPEPECFVGATGGLPVPDEFDCY